VAYGNREVHIHPDCKRRLSVFEAMKLQGFPDRYRLIGTLSSQILQVSEAVPPPLAQAIAGSVAAQLVLVAANSSIIAADGGATRAPSENRHSAANVCSHELMAIE